MRLSRDGIWGLGPWNVTGDGTVSVVMVEDKVENEVEEKDVVRDEAREVAIDVVMSTVARDEGMAAEGMEVEGMEGEGELRMESER